MSWYFKGSRGGPPLLLGEPPHDLNTWFACCRTIANMHGLRNLRIDITQTWSPHDHSEVLTPLKSLHLEGTFEIFWPWQEDLYLNYVESLPFVLKYDGEDPYRRMQVLS